MHSVQRRGCVGAERLQVYGRAIDSGNRLREADDDSPVKDEPFLLYEGQVGMSYRQGFQYFS